MALEIPGLILYILVRIFIKYLNRDWMNNLYKNGKAMYCLRKRFTVLSTLFNRWEMSTYITAVKNPDIRNIYTRLRFDMNVLSTSRSCKNIKDMCPLCNTEPETVSHFILKCHQFSYLRGKFYDNVSSHSPDLKDKNDMTQLNLLLQREMWQVMS